VDLGLIAGIVASAAGVAGVGVGIWQLRKGASVPSLRPPELADRLPSWADVGAVVTVPIFRLPAFVRGRDELLRVLKQQLRSGGLAVVAGPGGMGTSTVARELVRRMPPRGAGRKPSLVWEVSGATVNSLAAGLITVARDAGGTEADLRAIATLAATGPDRFWKLLDAGPSRFLLIIDNADDPRVLAAPGATSADSSPRTADGTGWARTSKRGLVLVTSRQRDRAFWPAETKLYLLDRLSDVEAGKVLLDLAPNAGGLSQAQALGARLGGLPLVLHLAGRYLGSEYVENASFDSYRNRLDTDPRAAFFIHPDPDAPDAAKRRMVRFTWELSLDALSEHGLTQARPLLRLLSCYAPALPIPLSLLNAGLLAPFLESSAAPADNQHASEPASSSAGYTRLDQVLSGLDRLGLIDSAVLSEREADQSSAEQGGDGRTLDGRKALVVHPVIADTSRAYLLEPGPSDPQPSLVRQTAVDLMATALDGLNDDVPRDWPAIRVLTPHLQALITSSALWLDDGHLETLLQAAGHASMAFGQMMATDTGIELLTNVLSACTDRAVTATQSYLVARQQLASLLMNIRPADAEVIYREVLSAQLPLWPEDDPGNLAVRHSLAAAIASQGREEEARAAFALLLPAEQRVLGEDHPITLATREQLATLLYAEERYADAEAAFAELLPDEQRVFGQQSTRVFGIRHNLALSIFMQKGRQHQAEAAFRQLLSEERHELGDEHLVTKATQSYRDGTLLVTSVTSTPELRAAFADTVWDTALAHADRERNEQAAVAFRQVAEMFIADPDASRRQRAALALFNAGISLNKAGRSADALASFELFVQRFEHDRVPAIRMLVPNVLINRALLMLELNQPEDAVRATTAADTGLEAVAESGDEQIVSEAHEARETLAHVKFKAANALADRGDELMGHDQFDDAEACYQRLADAFSNDHENDVREVVAMRLFQHAVGLSEGGRKDESGAEFGKMAELFADDPAPRIRVRAADAFAGRAVVLLELGQREEALKAVERAAALYAEPAAAKTGLAAGGIDANQESAVTIYQQLADRFGDDPDAGVRQLAAVGLFNLAASMAATGKPELALTAIEQAISLYERIAEADGEQLAEQLDMVRRMRDRIRPAAAEALFAHCMAAGEQGRRDEAIAGYLRIEARCLDDPSPVLRELAAKALLHRANTLAELRRAGEAMRAYRELIRRFSDDRAAAVRDQVAKANFNLAADAARARTYSFGLDAIESAIAIWEMLADDHANLFRSEIAEANKLRDYLMHKARTPRRKHDRQPLR
jgi:tetratricopeptide (TPR) repeat protein